MSKYYSPRDYKTQDYLSNDLSGKLAWYFHILLTKGVVLNGLMKDEGKVCDLYSDKEEYEVMHNNGSWSEQAEFPFKVQTIHKRKNPEKYCRANLDSYFVQFREDFKLAQVTHSKHFFETHNGFQAPITPTKSKTIKVHPIAHIIGKVLYAALHRELKDVKS